jgi:uncharacterized repeat protein (TIGR01451 family)/gliding motility-associated-like protein
VDSNGDIVELEKSDQISQAIDPLPSIAVTKAITALNDGGDGLDVGETVLYTITITNEGNISLTDVDLVDTIKALDGTPFIDQTAVAVSYIGSSFDDDDEDLNTTTSFPENETLQPGEYVEYEGLLTINQAMVDAGGVLNTVLVDGAAGAEQLEASANADEVPIVAAPAVTVTKASIVEHVGNADENNRVIRADDRIKYTISIENTGNVTLTNLVVSDLLEDGLGNALNLGTSPGEASTPNQWTIASLDPNASAEEFTVFYTIDQTAALTGRITNTVEVTGDSPLGAGTVSGVSNEEITQIDLQASLKVTKDDKWIDNGDGEANVGDLIEYTIEVTNTGEVPLTSIMLEDVFKAGDNLTDLYLSSPSHNQGDMYPWETFDLAAGASRQLKGFYIIEEKAINTGSVRNYINASATKPDGSALTASPIVSDDPRTDAENDNTITTFTQAASILITKTTTAENGTYEINDIIDYTIKIKNTGNTSLNGVEIDELLTTIDNQPLNITVPSYVGSSAGVNSNFETDKSLKVDEEVTLTASFTVNQTAIDAGGIKNMVSVSAVPNDTNVPVTHQLFEPVVTLINANPALEIVKTKSVTNNSEGIVGEGATINYNITVSNTGNVSMTGVSIEDFLVDDKGTPLTLTTPNPATWDPVAIDPGKDYTFYASYTLTEADRFRSKIINSATATGYDPSGGEVVAQTTLDVEVDVDPDPSFEVFKSARVIEDSDTTTQLGDVIQYTIEITNTGNRALTIDNIEDQLSKLGGGVLTLSAEPSFVRSSLNSAAGTLATQETATYIATFIIDQDAIDAGGVSNVVTVTASDETGALTPVVSDDPSTILAIDDPTETILTRTPAVEVTKTAQVSDNGNGVNGPEDLITYTIEVANTGNVTLINLVVTDVLNAVSGSTSSLRGLSTPVTHQTSSKGSAVGTLKVGEVATYTATYEIAAADFTVDKLSNVATANAITAYGSTTNGANDPTETLIEALAAIEVQKEIDNVADNGDLLDGTGDTIYYTITLTNTGNTVLDEVTLSDTITDANGNATVLTQIDYDTTNTGVVGTLEVGETARYTVEYLITQTASESGLVKNTVTVTAKDPADNLIEGNASVPLSTGASPSMEVTKTWSNADDFTGGIVGEGDTVEFSIEVTNTGNVELNSVAYNDILRDGNDISLLSQAEASTFLTYDTTNNTGTEGVLAVGETAIYTASYTITASDFATGFISNQVYFTGLAMGKSVYDLSDDPTDPNSNENDPTVIPMGSDPSMKATKSVRLLENGDGILGVGDTVEFTIGVTNTGNTILSNVTIDDNDFVDDNGQGLNLTAGPSFTISSEGSGEGTLIPGEQAFYTASFALTQPVVDSGGLSNQATITADSPGITTALEVLSDDPVTDQLNDATKLSIEHNPIIEVVKTAQAPSTDVGDTIGYTIHIENKGNVTLDNVTLDDVLTDGTGLETSLNTDLVFDNTSGVEGTIEVGQTVTYTLDFLIDQTAFDSGKVMNTILVTADSPKDIEISDRSDDGDDTDGDIDDDPTLVTFTHAPEVEITKEVASITQAVTNQTGLGDTINYTITVNNTGDVTLTNINVTDILTDAAGNTLTLTTGPPLTLTTLAPGASHPFTATYQIEQQAVNSGEVSNNATVSATSPLGEQVSGAIENLVVTEIDQSPSLIVEKEANLVDNGDLIDGIGDIVQYTITVTNNGNVNLTGITVTDTLKDKKDNLLELSSGQDLNYGGANMGSLEGTLKPNEIATYTAYHIIDQDIVDAGGIYNVATVNANGPGSIPLTPVDSDATETLIVANPEMEVVKTAKLFGNTDEIIETGDLISYTIVVTNTGNVTLVDVAVTDVLSDGEGDPIELTTKASIDGVKRDIPPGESVTYEVTYLIEQDAADTGSVSNVATASATLPDGTSFGPIDSDPAVVIMTENPSITINKTAVENDGINGQMDLGETIDYTITVTNNGNVTLEQINIIDTLTDGKGIEIDLTSQLAPASLNSVSQTTPITRLEVDDIATYSVQYSVDQAAINSGKLTNIATVTASTVSGTTLPTVTSGQVETIMSQAPEMTITKIALENDNGDGLDLGETITYTIEVENTGNVELTNVVVIDNALIDNTGEALILTDGPTYTGTGAFDGTLLVGETVSYTATFTVNQQAINAGGLSNTASATATTPTGESISEDSNTEPTTISAIADLQVTKDYSIRDNGDGIDGLGDFVEYTIEVTNTGEVILENVSIVDTFTDNDGEALTFTLEPFFAGASDNSVEGTLKVGEIATYKAYFVINQKAVNAGGLINNVKATANAPGSTTEIDDELDTPTTTPIAESPAMEVIKTAQVDDGGDGSIDVGDTINYSIQVTNIGNVTLDNLLLTDTLKYADGQVINSDLPTQHTSSSQQSGTGTLLVGETAIYTATYTVTQEAIDAGGVMNSVTANADSPAGTSMSDISDDGDKGAGDTFADPTVTTIEAAPALRVEKEVEKITDNPSGIQDGYNGTGDEVEYAITVTNIGNVTLSLATLTDTISDANGTDIESLVNFTPAFTSGTELAVGTSIEYTVTYLIDAAVADTKLVRNTAVVTATPPTGAAIQASDIADVTTGADASLEVTKTWTFENDIANNNIVDVADEIKFIIKVKNTGNVTLTNIDYDDTFLDGNTTANLLSFDGTSSSNPTSLDFRYTDNSSSEGTLKAGESATYHAHYTVSQETYDSGEMTNTVTFWGFIEGIGTRIEDISDNGNDFDGNTEDDVTRISMGSFPSVEVTKTQTMLDTSADGILSAGDTVEYTVAIKNTGNVTLTWGNGDIVDNLTDKLNNPITPTPLTWQYSTNGSGNGEITEGETAYFTLSYVLTQSDVDSGGLLNRVEAKLNAPAETIIEHNDGDGDDSNDADGDGSNDNDPLVLDIAAHPDVEITKTATPSSGLFEVDDIITYTVELTNTGNVTLDNIVLTDTLTDGGGKTSDLSGALTLTQVNGNSQTSLTALGVGDTATYVATYQIDQAAIDSGRVENTVSVNALSPSGNESAYRSIDAPVVTNFTQNPVISLTKTATPNTGTDVYLDAGDTITYDIAVTNDGNVTLNDIELTDVLTHNGGGRTVLLTPVFDIADDGSSKGTLMPGETAHYIVTYTLTQDAINAGGVSNQATAEAIAPSGITISAKSNDPTTNDLEDPTQTTINGYLGLNVIKTADIQENGDDIHGVGDVVEYTINVENTGNLTLDVTLADTLKDAKGNDITLTSGTANLSIPRSIDPGITESYVVYQLIDQAIVDAGGLINTATATGIAPDGISSIADVSDDGDTGLGDTGYDPTVITIAAAPELKISKSARVMGDEDGFVGVTDIIDYTIRVTNTGNVTLYDVVLTDVLTDGNGNPLQIDTSEWVARDIAPGNTETYTAYYIIEPAAADSGSVINQVTATAKDPSGNTIPTVLSDDPDTKTIDNDPTTVEMDLIPSIEVIKEATPIDLNNDSKIGLGDRIEYTITVENNGNTALTSLDLTDTLTDLNGVPLTLTSGPNYVGSNQSSADATKLRIGEKATFEVTFIIDQQAVNAGGVSNTATAIASSPGKTNDAFDISDDGLPTDANGDGDPTNDPTIVVTDPNPSMEVTKTAIINDNGDSLNGAGDIIRYTIEVENTGDIVLNNVFIQNDTLTDGNGTLLALSSGPDYWQAQTVEVGQTAVFTALYVVSQEAAQTGYISNTAKAVGSSLGKANDIDDISDDGLATDGDGDGDPTNDPTIVLMDAPPVSSIEVTKIDSIFDSDGDNANSVGDIINYTITVENTGNTDLTGIALIDVLSDRNGGALTLSSGPDFESATLNSPNGQLRQGETANYVASYIITQQALNAGGVSNTVTGIASSPGKQNDIFDISDDGDDLDGNTFNDPTVTILNTTTPPLSSITLTKSATLSDTNGDGSIGEGDTITYTLVATNTGNDNLSNVNITDVLSDLNGNALTLTMQPTFISASSGSAQGSLQIGEQATYRATFIVNNQAMNAGGVSNTATVTAQGTSGTITDTSDDPTTQAPNDATVTTFTTTPPTSSIVLTKAASISDTNGDGTIGLGDMITYTMVATNTGNDALTSVTITDVLSDLAGNTLSLTTQPTFISANLGSAQGSLQIGEQATYRATFIVNNQAMNAGGVSNTATVTAQGTSGTITDTSNDPSTSTPNDPTITRLTTVTPQSSIEVTKTARITDNGNGTTGLGDTITFLITVENTGNTVLNGVVVNDTFSDLSGNALTLTSGPLFVSANLGSGEGTLLAGETATYTATFVVDAQADNAGGVSNTASATAIDPSGTPVNDISDDGDDTDGNTTNDPTVLAFFQDPVDGDFEVFNGMSPGDDGINDYFKIAGIEKYPNNTVKIFNRWGILIYEAKGYGLGDRLFMGISEGRITITKDQKLPAGTYFYVIEFDGENPGRERYTGYLYINRD